MDMQRILALQQQLGKGGYGSPSSVPEIQNARQMGSNLSAYNQMPAIQALRQNLFGQGAKDGSTRIPQQPPMDGPQSGVFGPAQGGMYAGGSPGFYGDPNLTGPKPGETRLGPVVVGGPGMNPMYGPGVPPAAPVGGSQQAPGVAALRSQLGSPSGEGQGGGGAGFFRHQSMGNWSPGHTSTPFENWRRGLVQA